MSDEKMTGLDVLPDEHIGLEARTADEDHQSLKLWLRVLACTTQIETIIRKRLRQSFGVTLARFDYMAQLYRNPEGLRMNVLSSYMMVTGGSVTGLTDELEREGLVLRDASSEDRRVTRVKLTDKGRLLFQKMALEHERWIVDLFSGLSVNERKAMYQSMGNLRLFVTKESTE